MEEFSQFAEYSVKKSEDKSLGFYRILFPVLSVLGTVFFCVALMTIVPIELSIIISILVFIALLLFSNNKLHRVEFDYRITNGELYFAEVYNGKRRKEMGSVIISKLEAIAPYSGAYKASAERGEYDNIYDFSSSLESPDVYYAVNRDEENGTLDIFFFEPSDKMLRLLRFHNRRTVVLKDDIE